MQLFRKQKVILSLPIGKGKLNKRDRKLKLEVSERHGCGSFFNTAIVDLK